MPACWPGSTVLVLAHADRVDRLHPFCDAWIWKRRGESPLRNDPARWSSWRWRAFPSGSSSNSITSTRSPTGTTSAAGNAADPLHRLRVGVRHHLPADPDHRGTRRRDPGSARARVPAAGAGEDSLARTGGLSVPPARSVLVIPIVYPSQWLAAPVWLGFILLLDPINASYGAESIRGDLRSGHPWRLVNLLIGGVVCGFLWEFWNFWAHSKWVYTVPVPPDIKIFEMPVAGYLGFPAFAVECFAMYVFARHWVWRGTWRPTAL